MRTYLYLLGLLFILNSCDNETELLDLKISEFNGIWTIEKVLANDHWGGPLYWRETDQEKQIKFTAENKYFEKTKKDFELIGTFKIISDNQIEITWDKPIRPEHLTYQLYYTFDSKNLLTLHKNQYEGIVAEKYSHNF